jgi:hypothetical protein
MKLSFKPFKPTATYAGQDKARKELNFIQSTEATVKIDQRTRTLFDKWLDKHPDIRTRIKDTKLEDHYVKAKNGKLVQEFKYLVIFDQMANPGIAFPVCVEKPFREFTLLELMSMTTAIKESYAFFVVDDETSDYVGFIAYFKANQHSKTINNVVFFKFDNGRDETNVPTGGSLFTEILQIMALLFENHNEVNWVAVLEKDNPVIRIYNLYLDHKRREGCVTSKIPFDQRYLSESGGNKVAKLVRYTVQN